MLETGLDEKRPTINQSFLYPRRMRMLSRLRLQGNHALQPHNRACLTATTDSYSVVVLVSVFSSDVMMQTQQYS